MATYNVVNILAGEVEMGKCPEVDGEGEAPSLFEVVSVFSNQIYGQTYHGGLSQMLLQRGSFSAPAKHSACSRARSCLSRRETDTCELKFTSAGYLEL